VNRRARDREFYSPLAGTQRLAAFPSLGTRICRFVDEPITIRTSSRTKISSGWWDGVPRRGRTQKTKSSIPPET